MSALTQYGFTMGQGVLEVKRACESKDGERRRWACVDVQAGPMHIMIQCSARRCWITYNHEDGAAVRLDPPPPKPKRKGRR